jgi:hypothetical protein
MKTNKLVILMTVVMGLGTQVYAQSFIKKITDNLSGGFKLEGNVSNFILSDMPGTTSKMNVGSTFGGFVNLKMSEHITIQEDVLVNYKTSTFEQADIKSDFQLWSVGIPIYVMGYWPVNKNKKAYIGIGPFTEYGLSAKYKTGGKETDLYEKDKSTDKAYLAKLTMGITAIAGYEFNNGIQINAGYKIGFTNALDEKQDEAFMRPYAINLGIGYHF